MKCATVLTEPVARQSRILLAGRTPSCWQERITREARRATRMPLLCAWVDKLADQPPPLRKAPLFGHCLEGLVERRVEPAEPESSTRPFRSKPTLPEGAPTRPSGRRPSGAGDRRPICLPQEDPSPSGRRRPPQSPSGADVPPPPLALPKRAEPHVLHCLARQPDEPAVERAPVCPPPPPPSSRRVRPPDPCPPSSSPVSAAKRVVRRLAPLAEKPAARARAFAECMNIVPARGLTAPKELLDRLNPCPPPPTMASDGPRQRPARAPADGPGARAKTAVRDAEPARRRRRATAGRDLALERRGGATGRAEPAATLPRQAHMPVPGDVSDRHRIDTVPDSSRPASRRRAVGGAPSVGTRQPSDTPPVPTPERLGTAPIVTESHPALVPPDRPYGPVVPAAAATLRRGARREAAEAEREDLVDLAAKVKRILDDDARRHGIEV